MIKVLPTNLPWHFSTIYASTNYNNRKILWENLINFAHSITGSWLLAGDFNKILTQHDKWERGRG